MNFEKFMKRGDIDKDYLSVSKKENAISQGRFDRSSIFNGLMNLQELDFLGKTADISTIASNKIFDIFRNKVDKSSNRTSEKRKKFDLLFSGPLIKSIVDPYYVYRNGLLAAKDRLMDNLEDSGPHIRNELVVNVVSEYSTLECLSIKKSNQVSEYNSHTYDPRLYYQIDIDNFSFFIRKKSYLTPAEAITSTQDNMDRIGLFGSSIWVSGLFILEFHNRIQTIDYLRVDPVFGYPADILNIYDRTTCVTSLKMCGLFKSLIDRADLARLTSVLDELDELVNSESKPKTKITINPEMDIENVMIIDAQQKYSVIEYLMLKMMNTSHMVILQSYHNMFMTLLARRYVFIRSPIIYARVIGFDKLFPSLFMMLGNVRQMYPQFFQDIPPTAITELNITSIYHIDMYLIRSFIQIDDENLFVDLATRTKLVKKLSSPDSKTGRMIIDWLILHNPQKIISTLVDTRSLRRADIFRIIFLTESFNLLDDDILDYIKYMSKKEDRKKTVLKIPAQRNEENKNILQNHISKRNSESISDEESTSVTERGIMKEIESGEILDCDEMAEHRSTKKVITKHSEDLEDILYDELDDELNDEINDISSKKTEINDDNASNNSDNIDDDDDTDDNINEINNGACKIKTVIPKKKSQNSEDSDMTDSDDSDTDSTASIDPDDMLMILNTLEDVVKSGLSHSFFLIHQICPQILDDGFLESIHYPNPTKNIIHWIRSDNSIEVLQLMLKFRPDIVNAKNEKNLTTLLSLVDSDNYQTGTIEKVLVHLLTSEADYEETDEKGNTILHMLAQKGDVQLVNTVLRLVPSIINHQNNDMMTPIMLAAQKGDESMVYSLEAGNADLTLTDRDGNTVYHYICRSGICPNTIVFNTSNIFGFRPSDYSIYCEDFYYFR